jgi:hypothetical protein
MEEFSRTKSADWLCLFGTRTEKFLAYRRFYRQLPTQPYREARLSTGEEDVVPMNKASGKLDVTFLVPVAMDRP